MKRAGGAQVRSSAGARGLVCALALAAAACAEPRGDGPLSWEARAGDGPWQAAPADSGWVRGDYAFRARLPAVTGPVPGVQLRRARDLVSVSLDGRPLERAFPGSADFLLPEQHAGALLEARYRTRTWTRYGPSPGGVGPELALWQQWVDLEFPNLAGGVLLVLLSGGLLALGLARRASAKPLVWLGAYALTLGWVFLAQSRVAALALPSPRLWFLTAGTASYLYPAFMALFVRDLFGDAPRRPLRALVVASVALVAVSVLFEAVGFLPLDTLQVGAYVLLVLIFAVSVGRVWPAVRAHDRAATAFLLGALAGWALGLPEIARDAGLPIGQAALAPVGQLFFVFGMGAALVAQVQDQRRRLSEASSELAARLEALEARNRDVQALNVELRRQVVERSRDLEKALGGVLTTSPGSTTLAPGEVFGSRFRIDRQLGRGGMGVVYGVTRLSDGKALALKVMTGQANAESGRRFAREAEIAARLQHPHLVSVLDVGVTEGGTLFLAMDLVNGQSLEALRPRFGDRAWGLPLLADAAEGLAALHREGVVHRDLKPANVLVHVDAQGRSSAMISDFGIARVQGYETDADGLADTARGTDGASPALSGGSLTRSGAMMGTPMYMAPEMARGAQAAGPASDVFTFGLMAWEVLSGHRPWADPPIFQVMGGRPLVPPAHPLPGLGGAGPLLLLALDPNPARRPTAEALAKALRAELRGAAGEDGPVRRPADAPDAAP